MYRSNVKIYIYVTKSSQNQQFTSDADALGEISLNPMSDAYSALQKRQRTEMHQAAHSCTEDEQIDVGERRFYAAKTLE